MTVRMRKLFCAFVVRIWHKTGFLMTWLKYTLDRVQFGCFMSFKEHDFVFCMFSITMLFN